MLKSYFKTALRSILRNAEYSSINILGLAISIASCVLLFVVLRFETSFDDFHANKESIYRVVLDFKYPEGEIHTPGVPPPTPEAFRTDFTQLKKIATTYTLPNSQINVLKDDKQEYENKFKEERGVAFIEPEFFEMFDFPFIQGDPSVLSEPNTAVLTQTIAEKYFGTWQNAIGKFIQHQNTVLKVSGILKDIPANSDFPIRVAISYKTRKNIGTSWGNVTSDHQLFIQLPDGMDVSQLRNLLPAFEKSHYDVTENAGRYALEPLADLHFDSRYHNWTGRTVSKSTLLSLGVIGIFLLITASINFINLAIAQVVKKSKEVGVRKVLGSRHSQLVLQFFGETFIILVIASCIAMIFSEIGLPLLRPILDLPQSFNPILSIETFAFLSVLIIVLTLISGIYPAGVMARFKPIQALKNKISQHNIGGVSLRKGLVVVQFVIAQILITVAMVIFLQLDFFQNKSLGFEKEGIIYFPLPNDSLNRTKFEALRNVIVQQPGVKDVSFSMTAPSSTSSRSSNFRFNTSAKEEPFEVYQKFADTSFFTTYNIPLLAGRIYQTSDTTKEYVVNETFLKKLGMTSPDEVIGKTITMDNVARPIVGVMKDFHLQSLHTRIEPLIISSNKEEFRIVSIKLASENINETLEQIGNTYASFFPALIFEYQFLDDRLARSYRQEQRLGSLVNIFSGIAIFISCLGLYGLISFMALQRTKEVGVRKVLGASVMDILLLFSKEFIFPVIVAFAIAAPAAGYFMQGWLNTFAFHIQLSAWIFIISIAGTTVVALVTLSSQSIKAALANPVNSLRNE